MGRSCDAVPTLELDESSQSRKLETITRRPNGNPQKRWFEAEYEVNVVVAARTMDKKSTEEFSVIKMRSDERLAERIANDVIANYDAKNILDVGCGDGIIAERLSDRIYYQGLDISDACIYDKRLNNGSISYINPQVIESAMEQNSPWEMVLLLDVMEHTRGFTTLFEKALSICSKYIIVSLPNELFFTDRIKMLFGRELNAHSLDLINMPEGFKHQYIINIEKAKSILNERAKRSGFRLTKEIARSLEAKSLTKKILAEIIRRTTNKQVWSMGSILVYEKLDT